MDFKVGDRVNVYASFMSNEPLRGTIVDNCASQKDTILLKVRFDNFRGISSHEEWIHAQQCRKLVKKPIKFEVGDRCVIEIEGKKQKGTILPNSYCNPDYYVKFDDGFHGFFPIRYRNSKCKYVRKLVKKKTEFKVGDRVVFKENGVVMAKGNICEICNYQDGSAAANIGNMMLVNVKHLKKLVKKKNSEKKPFFEWMSKIILKDLEKESKEPKLLPCPFCGSDDIEFSFILIKVQCKECGACGGLDDGEEKSIKQWNRRSYP